MIRHEDIGVNLPARLGASLAQRLDEALAIRVIQEDRPTAVPAIHNVVNRAGILDSQLAGHARRMPRAQLYVNFKTPLRVVRRSRSSASSTKQRSQPRIRRPCRSV